MSEKRYCLERLRLIEKNGTETWVRTKKCSDRIGVLESFMSEGYRIYDMKDNKEVKRKVNLNNWR